MLARDTHCEIIKHLTFRSTSDKPDVRSMGRLATTCQYFRDLININEADDASFIRDPREKTRRQRIAALNHNNPLWDGKYDSLIPTICSTATSHETVTLKVLMKYKNMSWNFRKLTTNPNITIEILLDLMKVPEFEGLKTIYFKLSARSVITFAELINSGLQVDVCASVSVLTMRDYTRSDQSTFDRFTSRAKITMQDVIDNPHFNWSPDRLLINNHIMASDVFEHFNIQPSHYADDDDALSYMKNEANKKFVFNKILEAFLDVNTPYRRSLVDIVSKYADLSTIINNINAPWDWQMISWYSKTIKPSEMIQHAHLPFDWQGVVRVARVPINANERHPYVKFQLMADCGKLTDEIIDSNPNVEWRWGYLCELNSVSISRFVGRSWIFKIRVMLRRPDCTLEYILNNINQPDMIELLKEYLKTK